MVYGVDLVREQLRIASGLPMSVPSTYLYPRGWSIECRITSEDPASGFLPSTGRITMLKAPGGPGVRWDAGVEAGNEVTLFYDSLLAKLIVWAPNRTDAIARMGRALEELVIAGVATNVSFHQRLMADEAFREGDFDIQMLERRPELFEPPAVPPDAEAIAVMVALAEDATRASASPAAHVGVRQGASRWTDAARRDGLR
jgi:acetyl/propionyl-CoA carboxylase alpha subunit